MKPTVLDMTQSILSNLGSDEVNSISDNPESMQVAEILKQTYFNIISRVDLPDHDQLVQLDPSLDATVPVLMYVPQGISRISSIKYFNSFGTPVHGYEYVDILPIHQFVDTVTSFNPSDSDVESFTFNDNSNGFNNSYTFYFKNNKQPQYCTILSNYYVIFDGYDSTLDSTLQASKTLVSGKIIPAWSMTDDFIPNLSEEQFVLLLSEAKSLAFFELKQSAHPKAEQEAKRAWSSVQKDKSIINRPTYFNQLPDFGRRGYRNVSYFKTRGWD